MVVEVYEIYDIKNYLKRVCLDMVWYSQGILVCSEIDLPTEPIHVSKTR